MIDIQYVAKKLQKSQKKTQKKEQRIKKNTYLCTVLINK